MSKPLTKTNDALLLAVLILGAITSYYVLHELQTTPQNKTPTQSPSSSPTTTSSPSKTPTATSTTSTSGGNGALQLTLILEKTTYTIGEPVDLTVTITNISNQTVNFTHTGLDFDFQVNNDTNNLVYRWSNFRPIAQFITIEPFPAGETRSLNFTWQQTCNFNTSVQGEQVSAGTYFIMGQSGSTYGLQTTPIQITITKP